MKEYQQGPMENLLDGLDKHAEFLSQEELKSELRDRGINVDAFLKRAHDTIAHHEKAERLAWMKVADENKRRLEDAGRNFESWLGKGEEAIRAAWAIFIANAGPQRAFAFRKRTDLTVEDMARILDDNERLKQPPQEK